MKLSIIIPARGEFPNIVHTFHSLCHCLEADGFTYKDFEIIVVDNGSNDDRYPQRGTGGTTSYLETRGGYFNRVLRIIRDPICGNHSARNRGAEIARGEYLYFSDAHMALRPGFFKSIIKSVDESGGLVHGALQFMGAYPPTDNGMGFGYSVKLGEEIKGCVDEQTEILTKTGWKKWNEVNMESEFATVKMDNHEIEFQKPKDIVVREHNGMMVKITGRSYDALLTPYHRTIYQTQSIPKWRIKEAIQISSTDKLPLGTSGLIKEEGIYSDELVELIGWIITEGSFREDGSICITQYSKENRESIFDLLNKLTLSFFIKGTRNKKPRKDIIININPSKGIRKILPKKELTIDFINLLNRKQLEKLYRVLIDADGTKTLTNESFIQVNKTTINAFQYLCVLIGKQSKLYTKKPEVFKDNHFGKQDIQVVSVKKNKRISNFKKDLVDYKGIVWCPELQNGTIFCRRNGHTYPSAQTWNNYKVHDKWFYVPAQGHWGVCVKKNQFFDFGGYPKIHRTYGGGEFYLDMKWWLFGSTVAVDPNAVGYHLASSRGYNYNHDDYVHNVFNIGVALGMDEWVERYYLNLLRKSNKQVLDRMLVEAYKETEEDRKFIEGRRTKTFNELIVDRTWDKKNDERCGHHFSGFTVFHQTMIDLIKQSPVAWEAYQNSKYQVSLDKFITENLNEFIYKKK